MFTIKFEDANHQGGSTTRDTIADAQAHAREIMSGWDLVTVYYTDCIGLILFRSVCGIVVKEINDV